MLRWLLDRAAGNFLNWATRQCLKFVGILECCDKIAANSLTDVLRRFLARHAFGVGASQLLKSTAAHERIEFCLVPRTLLGSHQTTRRVAPRVALREHRSLTSRCTFAGSEAGQPQDLLTEDFVLAAAASRLGSPMHPRATPCLTRSDAGKVRVRGLPRQGRLRAQ